VEVHPFFGNEEVRAANAGYGVHTEAWSPLAQGNAVKDPVIGEIATRLGKTPAQVTLRWHIERGDIVFPKSVTPSRIKENFEIFDFSLSPDDVAAIAKLDQGAAGRIGPNPDTFDWIPG